MRTHVGLNSVSRVTWVTRAVVPSTGASRTSYLRHALPYTQDTTSNGKVYKMYCGNSIAAEMYFHYRLVTANDYTYA